LNGGILVIRVCGQVFTVFPGESSLRLMELQYEAQTIGAGTGPEVDLWIGLTSDDERTVLGGWRLQMPTEASK
jgi:hypothetical protein